MHAQVVLVLRWLRHRASVHDLAADAGISDATAYRYRDEGLKVIAARAPDLDEVLAAAHREHLPYLCLDGTLIPTDRVAGRTTRGNDTWYSGKHHRFGGNVQVIADPAGRPRWVSPVRPGSWHDLACARELVLGALYPHTALHRSDRIPVLADKGYIGAGIGVITPVKRPRGGDVLDLSTRTYNRLHAGLRGPAEGANAALKTWRALQHVTSSPHKITTIAAAALVLTNIDRGRQ